VGDLATDTAPHPVDGAAADGDDHPAPVVRFPAGAGARRPAARAGVWDTSRALVASGVQTMLRRPTGA
jgi:hypothetical protein